MICLLCPKCQKVLSVNEAHRGGIGQCPHCAQKFRIPGGVPQPTALPPPVSEPPTLPPPVPPPPPRPSIRVNDSPRLPGEPATVNSAGLPPPPVRAQGPRPAGFPDFELTPPAEPPTMTVKFQPQRAVEEDYETLEVDDGAPVQEPEYDVVAEVIPTPPIPVADVPAAVRPDPPLAVPVVADDEPLDAVPAEPARRATDRDDEDHRRRPRRRRRRRRSSGGFSWPTELIPGVGNFVAIMIIIGALWVLIAGLALLLPPLGIFLVLLGGLLAVVGQIWFLLVAFQDDFTTGLLCLLLPVYALIYLVTNQENAGPPFLVNLLGVLMAASGIWLLGGFGG
jgi:hypothetical protein